MKVSEIYDPCQPNCLRMFLTDRKDALVLTAVIGRQRARLLREVHPGRDWRFSSHESERRRLVSEFIQKALARAGNGPGSRFVDMAFAADFPATWEFLTCCQLANGVARQTATVSLFAADGVFKAFLNDRETGKCLCVASRTVVGLWDALEAALTSDDPGWRDMVRDGGGKHSTRRGKSG